MNATTKHLQSMMRPYESPRHAVVAFQLGDGEVTYLNRGAPICEDPCEDWIFEIASITKVFTAVLLCRLVEEGKIDPKAPLRDMSDALKDVPDWITAERLTSHTSGLPNYFMPLWKALFRQQPDGPYATFSRSDLLAWLHNRRSIAAPRQNRHVYSNVGVGLLGEAMAMMEGKPFVELLAEKVTGPMGLQDTADRLVSGQQRRFAKPKAPNGKSVPPWTFQSLAAAGCLRSSARDLACFAMAVLQALNGPETALDRAICQSTLPILGLGPGGALTPTAQCYGWLLVAMDKQKPGFLFHNGGTAGSSCSLHICPERKAAFGILSNNGVAGNLWASTKLNWSNPLRKAHDLFANT
ncbi:CubicO group peptidase, beta-lactamase class C family [Cognatiyoonia koreensis]|uniref:CubicO group peptidase, beta-lactamase class C family n=1 Tax=Cognatiyoonia koreensis TaxID=364200 RepID=A0A1I0MJL9_9RHOB|nr:serine hydrolase [Cognatiyoonia koreensis]SEV88020.1 CubicO group peptidase, beta-lactamase class C family [Cognatiyoonia koreensis]